MMQTLSHPGHYAHIARDLMRNGLVFVKRRLLGSRVRNRKAVQREYELGQWQTLLNGKEWRKYGSIRASRDAGVL